MALGVLLGPTTNSGNQLRRMRSGLIGSAQTQAWKSSSYSGGFAAHIAGPETFCVQADVARNNYQWVGTGDNGVFSGSPGIQVILTNNDDHSASFNGFSNSLDAGELLYMSGGIGHGGVSIVGGGIRIKLVYDPATKLQMYGDEQIGYDAGADGGTIREWLAFFNFNGNSHGTELGVPELEGEVYNILRCKDNNLYLSGLPNGCSVVVSGNIGATLNIGPSGLATIDLGEHSFPVILSFDVYSESDGQGQVFKSLHGTSVYGGDNFGFQYPVVLPPIPPQDDLPGVRGQVKFDWIANALFDADGATVSEPSISLHGSPMYHNTSLGAAPTIARLGANNLKCVRTVTPIASWECTGGNPHTDFVSDFTFYHVSKIDSAGPSVPASGNFYDGAQIIGGENSGAVTDYSLAMFSAGNIMVGGLTTSGTTGGNLLDGNPHVVTLRRRQSDGLMEGLIDGVIVSVAVFDAGGALAAANPNTPYFYNAMGDIARIRAYNARHSDAEVATIVAALRAMYGF